MIWASIAILVMFYAIIHYLFTGKDILTMYCNGGLYFIDEVFERVGV